MINLYGEDESSEDEVKISSGDSDCESVEVPSENVVSNSVTEDKDSQELFTVDTAGNQGNDNDISDDPSDSEDGVANAKSGDNLFRWDTLGQQLDKYTSNLKQEEGDDDDDDDDDDVDEGDEVDSDDVLVTDLPVPKFPVTIKKQDGVKTTSSKKNETYDLNDTYLDIQLGTKKATPLNRGARMFTKVDEILKKSVIKPGFEKLDSVPSYHESYKILLKKRKKERERTKGSQWFNMPATEMTEELKNDLEVLQMRSVLDPKHFYKKNDLKVLPKYFQVGKVVDNAADFYHSRLPKKERKRTIVEELLADAEFKNYNKRRYKEIIEQKSKTHYKAHARAKKLKRKK